MRGKTISLTLIFLIAITLFYSSSINAKTMPSEFKELVTNSDLIAIVNVFEINSQGKSSTGSASARITKRVVGKNGSAIVKLHWQGIAITGLGQWLVFLKKNTDGYKATYGARSFWKIDLAILDKNECCSPFVVLVPPVTDLIIDKQLFSDRFVYINGIPRERNPIKVKGIEINRLLDYVKNITAMEDR